MIELAPHTAMMVYLAVTLTLLMGSWLFGHLRQKRKTTLPSSGQLYLCEYCQSVYYDSISKKVTTCPECSSLNQDNAYKTK